MPGILPMKVIKIGTASQSRIAQACDRCRSKKIRCDGITPCCSQCSNVGFECKTSDKLSRRAFPRGYTESLEERVRALETEVRELKDLLDEKDEKIDLLSRIHSFSSRASSTTSISSDGRSVSKSQAPQFKTDVFRSSQSPCLVQTERKSDSFFVGQSSARALIDVFKSKIDEAGRRTPNFSAETLLEAPSAPMTIKQDDQFLAPPRLVSDQLVNIFFQEWAPLFPVLHRPTFLRAYTEFVVNPDAITDNHTIAQLNLIFELAALTSDSNKSHITAFRGRWQTALDAVTNESSIATLQCLILAQLCCIAKAENDKLLHYAGLGVKISHRLGLHLSQMRFSMDPLRRETRKKVFWCLYTLDCFTSSLLGLPRLIKDEDVDTEEPADVDDENVSESGFQPALPGEPTKVSSAIAMVRLTKVLSNVLKQLYPVCSDTELSLQKVEMLADELDAWRNSLAPHLRLEFCQDKPSTRVTGDRSALLSVVYYYIRSLIHRTVISSDLGPKAASSIMALADSSKHIIQIISLLEERRMSFTVPLNRNEMLITSGIGLLYQGLTLRHDSKLIADHQRLVCEANNILQRAQAPGSSTFKGLACSLISIERFVKPAPKEVDHSTARRASSASTMLAGSPSTNKMKSTRQQLQAIASRFTLGASTSPKQEQRSPSASTAYNSMPGESLEARAGSQISLLSTRSEPAHPPSLPLFVKVKKAPALDPSKLPNLDYFPLGSSMWQSPTPPTTKATFAAGSDTTDQDRLFGYLDNIELGLSENTNDYLSPDMLSFTPPSASSCDIWPGSDVAPPMATAQSVLSFSDESLSSSEELSHCDFSAVDGYAMPASSPRLAVFESFDIAPSV